VGADRLGEAGADVGALTLGSPVAPVQAASSIATGSSAFEIDDPFMSTAYGPRVTIM
jgi:hypothetical protein